MPVETSPMPPREDVNAISVKIGTMPFGHFRLCKRRPRRGTFPATRGAPRVGEFFYVFDRFGVAIALRCTRINADGVYFADRA